MAKAPAPRAQPPARVQEVEHDTETGEIRNNVVIRGDFGVDDPRDFEPVKYVSVPMLEVPEGATFIACLVEKMKVLAPMEGVKPKFPGDHIASTIKATNGAVRLFTWNTVFKSEMERDYPNDSYVGKWFQITKLPMKRGKNYHAFAITEVRPRGAPADDRTIDGAAEAA